jgi:inosose dehydratase
MRQTSGLFTRRGFIVGVGAAGVALGTRRGTAAPKAAASPINIGYAVITWGDASVKTAISEIAAAGYKGVQLRSNIFKEYATPEALKAELAAAKLTFACLSGGSPNPDPAVRAAEIEKFASNAKFAKAAGALVFQVTSPKRTATPSAAELKAYGELLNEVGKRTAAIGLPLAFHNHMAQMGETPEEIEAILAASDPRYVKLLLDTGHYAAAGGDSVKAIKKHGKRLSMLHIKDVRDKPAQPDAQGKPGKPYEFVELGQGKVDFRGVFDALKAVKYKGWVVVELDSVPAGRAPKDAAAANKVYLETKLGLSV